MTFCCCAQEAFVWTYWPCLARGDLYSGQHNAKHRYNPAAGSTEKSLCLPHNVTQWKTDFWNLKEKKKASNNDLKKKKDGQPNVLKWHFNYIRLFQALFSENISGLLWAALPHRRQVLPRPNAVLQFSPSTSFQWRLECGTCQNLVSPRH